MNTAVANRRRGAVRLDRTDADLAADYQRRAILLAKSGRVAEALQASRRFRQKLELAMLTKEGQHR